MMRTPMVVKAIYKFLAIPAFLLAAGVIASGCGGTDPGSNPNNQAQNNNPGSLYYPPGVITYPTSTSGYCGGQVVAGNLCMYRYPISGSQQWGGTLPILTAANPSGSSAWFQWNNSSVSTGIAVAPGDKVVFSGISGNWGNNWRISWSGPHCDVVAEASSSLGLMASDGVEAFLASSATSANPKRINNNGVLHLGFNVPDSYSSSSSLCGRLSISGEIQRCFNTSGTLSPCP